MKAREWCSFFILTVLNLTYITCLEAFTITPRILDTAHAAEIAYTNQLYPIPIASLKNNDAAFDNFYCIDTEVLHTIGFKGVTFFNPDTNVIIIAYRGTDESLHINLRQDVGILYAIKQHLEGSLNAIYNKQFATAIVHYYRKQEYLKMALELIFQTIGIPIISLYAWYKGYTQQQTDLTALMLLVTDAIAYYTKITRMVNTFTSTSDQTITYIVTGHSLGGFLAQMVGLAHADHPITYTFNSPGVVEFLKVTNSKYQKDLPKLKSIFNLFREHDIIGTVGTNIGYNVKLESYPTHTISTWIPGVGIEKFCEQNHSIASFNDYLQTIPSAKIEPPHPYTLS